MFIIDGKKSVVHQMINLSVKNAIDSNNCKLHLIISSIIFLDEYRLPFRRKMDNSVVFNDLLYFRVKNGDTILDDHFKNSLKTTIIINSVSWNSQKRVDI